MPRIARVKSGEGIFHIIVRSISELDLFKEDEDKYKYFSIIKKCQAKYRFAVYAYCLMDNHGHLIIDCLGADISKIMHYINFCYAQYYNRKYDRHGHVFQDRFKSKVVDSERYMINLSAYIHNNPKHIRAYRDDILNYPFSSLKEYIHGTDSFEVLNKSFLASLISFGNNEARKAYLKLVFMSENEDVEKEIEIMNTKTQYLSNRKIISRFYTSAEVIKYVAECLNYNKNDIYIKCKREYVEFRAISCFLMNIFCNMTQKEVCEVIGNISQAGISYLVSKGLEVVMDKKEILEKFIA